MKILKRIIASGKMLNITKRLIMINPYTGKMVVLNDPNKWSVYIMEVLIKEKNMKMIHWFIRFRYEQDRHNSTYFALNDWTDYTNTTPHNTWKIMNLLRELAYNLSRNKEEKEDETVKNKHN